MREYVRDLEGVVASQLRIYFGEDIRVIFAAVNDYAYRLRVLHEGLAIVSLRYQEVARPLPGTEGTRTAKPALQQQLDVFKEALDRHTGGAAVAAVPASPLNAASLPACSILGG